VSSQDDFVANAADNGFTWAVGLEALSYPDIPSHEAWWPAYQESVDGLDSWWDPLIRDPNADVEAAIPDLEAILQPIYDRATG
ncbi:MAG: hypothetical protein RI637_06900, partial [Acidimicrobiia bacterium]|nr:hypothetical protein [Acidimicrobiia bacterium]